jgi:hypothetical protein
MTARLFLPILSAFLSFTAIADVHEDARQLILKNIPAGTYHGTAGVTNSPCKVTVSYGEQNSSAKVLIETKDSKVVLKLISSTKVWSFDDKKEIMESYRCGCRPPKPTGKWKFSFMATNPLVNENLAEPIDLDANIEVYGDLGNSNVEEISGWNRSAIVSTNNTFTGENALNQNITCGQLRLE